jgi:Sugar kinases, ribokinase family
VFNISVAGHVCADLVPELPVGVGMVPGQLYDVGPLTIRPGGCVANTGFVLAQLGINARTAGLVGDDDLGRIVIRELGRLGLDVENILMSPGTTTSYSIVLEPAGMNRSFWHHTGASNGFDGTHVDLTDVDLLHVGYPPLLPGLLPDDARPLVDLLGRARRAEVTTSLDMAVVDRSSSIGKLDWYSIMKNTLQHVDVFTPSIDDLTSALEIGPTSTQRAVTTLAERMLADGVGVVMLSAGEDGLLIRTSDAARLRRGGRVLSALSDEWSDVSIWVEAREIDSIFTTNGAGDAASAAFLFGLINGLAPDRTGALATLVASQWIQKLPIDARVL